MDAHRARVPRTPAWRLARVLTFGVIAAFGVGIAGPATAVAGVNTDHVQLELANFITGAKKVNFSLGRFVENPVDPATVIATEAADGSTVITSRSAAAGGFTATAPCSKTEAQTAVCPARAEGFPVNVMDMHGSLGSDDFTADVPTYDAIINFEHGSRGSVPHSRTSSLEGSSVGEDILIGGTGEDRFFANGGRDTIFAFDEPAQRDTINCGSAAVERPVDIVHADRLDIFGNNNCGRIIIGP
jgi:hypothetical protein